MKKLLLSLYLLASFVVVGYSQSLTLSNAHGAIEPNSVIVQAGTPDSVELITYLNVKNISGNTVQVFCKKVQISMLDSTEISMCWAGNCYPAPVNVSPYAQTITSGQVITDFVGHYTQVAFNHFKSGESVVRWVFFVENNPSDSVCVTIKYTSFPLGIDDGASKLATLSSPSPNPADGSTSIRFNAPAGSDSRIIVRNLIGETVYSEQVVPGTAKLTLATANFSDGLYFCSLMVDGKLSQTRKLVVKH